MRILIFGAGAIGGYLGGVLTAAGADVTLVARGAQYEALSSKGLILEGARMGLDKGLEFESKCFGEVCGLEDSKIGMQTFREQGPRAKPPFIHR